MWTRAPSDARPDPIPPLIPGLFTPIRELFAGVPESRNRGYGPGRFSFNVKGGRCEACQGDGVIKVEMHFLPDIYVPCDVCHGHRYNRETLEIHYKGKNIHQILEMTVELAREFFSPVPVVARKLQTLLDVGLGYITLGQSATTLSGGEAQRVKLSLELSKRDTGRTLYILDEPTTGLHFHDIEMLLAVLQRLREHGNTVVIIEHNLDVIKTADWVVDLGPEGGNGGDKSLPRDAGGHSRESEQSYRQISGQCIALGCAAYRVTDFKIQQRCGIAAIKRDLDQADAVLMPEWVLARGIRKYRGVGQYCRTQIEFIAAFHHSSTQPGHGIAVMVEVDDFSQITGIEFYLQPHRVDQFAMWERTLFDQGGNRGESDPGRETFATAFPVARLCATVRLCWRALRQLKATRCPGRHTTSRPPASRPHHAAYQHQDRQLPNIHCRFETAAPALTKDARQP